MDTQLSKDRIEELFQLLQKRFEKHQERHKELKWSEVKAKLEACLDGGKAKAGKIWSLNEMEETGGEPDVIGYDKAKDEYIFCDCSPESPKGRRSVCYDPEALESRKEHKPKHSALGMAKEIGIELLDEEQYVELQRLGRFDTKTSSWVATPSDVRKLGGAIFGDWRYGRVFIYHNGAESYYGARGFRGLLRI
ncbi:MAG TPA: DUF4256 domain-containing protein [Cyclobacteriaceae bacterium]|nr:DUF4256 domain-containing protein [Cyclobacteriaceae bacterium]